jgi:hypothetical protein
MTDNPPPPKNEVLPKTAEECRADLERLRKDLAAGDINTPAFTLRSARLVHHMELLARKRKRYALT